MLGKAFVVSHDLDARIGEGRPPDELGTQLLSWPRPLVNHQPVHLSELEGGHGCVDPDDAEVAGQPLRDRVFGKLPGLRLLERGEDGDDLRLHLVGRRSHRQVDHVLDQRADRFR